MVRSTLRSQRITQNVSGHNGNFQNRLSFMISATFCVADLALELNPGSQYYEDSDAEVMVPWCEALSAVGPKVKNKRQIATSNFVLKH